jgi:PKD repeat protein
MQIRIFLLLLCTTLAACASFPSCSRKSKKPKPPLSADFTADPLSGDAPLSVRFSDASTGSVTSWEWDFDGDDIVDSTEQNPTHAYSDAGTYSVSLRVTGSGGSDNEAKTDYITVTAPLASSIKVIDGLPRLYIKGKQTPLLGFYIYRDLYDTKYDNVTHFKKYIDRAAEYGFTFVAFSIMWQAADLDETKPASPEEAASRIDWPVIDGIFDYAENKGVYLLPLFQYSHCTWWWHLDPELQGPEYTMRNQDGGQMDPLICSMDRMPAFCNPTWWKYLDAMLTFMVNRYKDRPALLGWLLAHGMSVENNYPGSSDGSGYGTLKMYDYCDFTVGEFRNWLRSRYGSDVNALRTAWGEPAVTFDDAQAAPPEVKQSNLLLLYQFSNSPGDTRRKFLDWQQFRLEQKKKERDHAARLIKSLDPEHILLADPGGSPFGCNIFDATAYSLPIDYYDYASNPDIDGAYLCPGVTNTSWNDKLMPSILHLMVRYFHSRGKAAFVQFENWDLQGDETRQLITELWNYHAWAYFLASLGCGVTWATGYPELIPGQDWYQAEFDPAELAEIARCAYLVQSVPRQSAPKPGIAFVDSPDLSMTDYYQLVPLEGADLGTKGFDVLYSAVSLSSCGLHFDILTDNDITANPQILNNYKAIALLDIFRMNGQLKDALVQFRQQDGGLALIGKTGVYDEFGGEDLSILKNLLGLSGSVTLQSNIFLIGKWTFAASGPGGLISGFENKQADTWNTFYIPKFDYGAEGFNVLAKLDDDPSTATAGCKDNVVFWFPKTYIADSTILPKFFTNLYDYYNIGYDSVPAGIFCSGTNYKFLISGVAVSSDLVFDLVSNGCETTSDYAVFDISTLTKIADVTPSAGKLSVNISLAANEPKLVALIKRPDNPFFLGGEWCALTSTKWDGSKLQLDLRARVGAEAKAAIDLAGKTAGSITINGGDVTNESVESGVLVISFTPAAKEVSVLVEIE